MTPKEQGKREARGCYACIVVVVVATVVVFSVWMWGLHKLDEVKTETQQERTR